MAVNAVATIAMNIAILLKCASGSWFGLLWFCWRLNQSSVLDLFNKVQGCRCDVVKRGGDEGCDFCRHYLVPVGLVDEPTIGRIDQVFRAFWHTGNTKYFALLVSSSAGLGRLEYVRNDNQCQRQDEAQYGHP